MFLQGDEVKTLGISWDSVQRGSNVQTSHVPSPYVDVVLSSWPAAERGEKSCRLPDLPSVLARRVTETPPPSPPPNDVLMEIYNAFISDVIT